MLNLKQLKVLQLKRAKLPQQFKLKPKHSKVLVSALFKLTKEFLSIPALVA